MKRKRLLSSHTKGTVQTIESLLEIVLLSVIYYLIFRLIYSDIDKGLHPYSGKGKYVLTGIYAVLSYLTIKNSDGFQFGQLRKADLLVAQWIAMLLVNAITYFQLSLMATHLIDPRPMLLLMVIDVVVISVYIVLMKVLILILIHIALLMVL